MNPNSVMELLLGSKGDYFSPETFAHTVTLPLQEIFYLTRLRVGSKYLCTFKDESLGQAASELHSAANFALCGRKLLWLPLMQPLVLANALTAILSPCLRNR